MKQTWYELEDGTPVNPAEVSTREDGRLVHASGKLIAMRFPDCPMTRSVNPTEYKVRAEVRDMEAEKPTRSYKTREAKTR